MTVTSVYSAKMLKEMGCCRVVPARELSLEEISRIYKETGMDIETFVHGALCYCYSGQCLMSSLIGGRSGNRGRCAQPCRLPYRVWEGGKAEAVSYTHPDVYKRQVHKITVFPASPARLIAFKVSREI